MKFADIKLQLRCLFCTLDKISSGKQIFEIYMQSRKQTLKSSGVFALFLWRPPGVTWSRKEFIWPRIYDCWPGFNWRHRNKKRETEASGYSLFSRHCRRTSAWRHLADESPAEEQRRGSDERQEESEWARLTTSNPGISTSLSSAQSAIFKTYDHIWWVINWLIDWLAWSPFSS